MSPHNPIPEHHSKLCDWCRTDPKISRARNADATCLECGQAFCGGHIGQHLKKVHCISLSLDHCRIDEPEAK